MADDGPRTERCPGARSLTARDSRTSRRSGPLSPCEVLIHPCPGRSRVQPATEVGPGVDFLPPVALRTTNLTRILFDHRIVRGAMPKSSRRFSGPSGGGLTL